MKGNSVTDFEYMNPSSRDIITAVFALGIPTAQARKDLILETMSSEILLNRGAEASLCLCPDL